MFTCFVGEKKHRQTTLQVELVNSLLVPKELLQLQQKNENLLLQKFQSWHQWYVFNINNLKCAVQKYGKIFELDAINLYLLPYHVFKTLLLSC